LTDAEVDRLADFLDCCKSGNAMNVEQLDGFFACSSPKHNPAQDGLGYEVKDRFDSTPRSKWLIDDGG
jgi:hypothetical protein